MERALGNDGRRQHRQTAHAHILPWSLRCWLPDASLRCRPNLARPAAPAEKMIRLLGRVLVALPADGPGPSTLTWVDSGSLASRIVVDSLLDGEAIDDYGRVCGDAARKAYG